MKAKGKRKCAVVLLSAILALSVLAGVGSLRQTTARAELTPGAAGSYDVVVYGATSAGVTAAIAAKREGASVCLVGQTDLIGGLTASGLGATDIANKNVVGGITRDFYNRVYEYYAADDAWTSETEAEYYADLGTGIYGGKSDTLQMQWVFEPKVAQQIFLDMLIEEQVPVILNEPIDLHHGVETEDGRIAAIVSQSGKRFAAKVFVDCSYEGDLMALAGVTYTVGREANSAYGETMNGILPNVNEYTAVSPYIVEGDPDSGLLPFIEDSALGGKGDADSRVQAYCFRFTLSTDPDNRVPITKPDNYHPEWYETRARILQANPKAGCELTQNRMPNHKTDTNHADFVGMSYEYADGDYLSRKKIEDDHRDYVLGLLYFYAYDERVPQAVREEMRTYGLARDEFTDNGNFPVQIYLREGRRMVSDYVMKESDVIQTSTPGVIQKTTAPHSVGQGFYWFDSHRVAYYMVQSSLGAGYQTDGNFWSSRRDYPISYESIRPKQEECVNLYVPVCLSSTHAAYGSIRMETTYMIVGESAGTAAAMSAFAMTQDADFCVQELDYAALAVKLAANGQLLGDIVADDLSRGSLAVLKLNVRGLVDENTATVLYAAFRDNAINTPERVGAVRDTLVKAARRIVKDTTVAGTPAVLKKFGILSNADQWASLFGEPLPETLSTDNVLSVFEKTIAFFANESPLGYIPDWVNYFYDNKIIKADLRDYLDDNGIGGMQCTGDKIAEFALSVARTLDPSVTDGDGALQIFANAKITGNAALWKPVFNGESGQSGSNVNGLLKNTFSYLKEHERDWKGVRIDVVTLDYLTGKGIVDARDAIDVLRGTADGATLAADTARKVVLAAAQYFDAGATLETAAAVLAAQEIDVGGVQAALDGNAADGGAMRTFLAVLCEGVQTAPIVDPLPNTLMQDFCALGIVSDEDAAYYNAGAVTGGSVEKSRLVNGLLSAVSSRLTVAGNTAIEKLTAVGALDADTAAALTAAEGTVDGVTANKALRSVHAYVTANNAVLSADNLKLLQTRSIVTTEEAEVVAVRVSQFGFVQPALGDKLFAGLAKAIDGAVTDRTGALDMLKAINAVGNTATWGDLLAGTADLSGKDCLSVVNVACKFINKTLADYTYLVEQGHLSQEDATYFLYHGNNSNTASVAKLRELFVALAKPLDETVTDATSAVHALKAAGITSNVNVWLAVVESTEEQVTVADLVNLVEKTVIEIKRREPVGDVEVLSDELLAYFEAKAYIKGTTYNAAYFKEYARKGATGINKGETKNMLIRAFRGISGNGASGAALITAVTNAGFTFSDDATENGELKDFWQSVLTNTGTAIPDIDGEELRVLMVRIYDYLQNKEAA